MNVFSSILVPLDGSTVAANSLGTAVWLAGKFDASLHLINATSEPLPAHEALAKLQIPRQYWSRVTLHQVPVYPEQAILEAADHLSTDLVIMAARGESANSQATRPGPCGEVGHVAHAVIENCNVPVLLTPPAFVEHLPWRSALVPISGETEVDDSLMLAVHLAKPLGMNVHLAHVVDEGKYGYFTEVQYADSPYYEYAGRLQELIDRASLQCSPSECRYTVEDVSLCQGDVAEELLDLIRRKKVDLLVVGWHGRLVQGHAGVVKKLLHKVSCPILLTRQSPPPEFELKVGDALE